MQLIGAPYCWGGRSPYTPDMSKRSLSCDCSGLVNIIYRSWGLELPRNAHTMWLCSTKINYGVDLEPGDLIFFARPDNPERVIHVLIYAGNETVIESCISLGIVQRQTVERLGKPVALLVRGDIIKGSASDAPEYVVYFGSYLKDNLLVAQLRNLVVGNYDLTKWILS
jgi:cell wall-associated NlpC family hydrolase